MRSKQRYVLQLNIRELLRFFDEAPADSASHATAIVSILGEDIGAALLQKRLEEDGIHTYVHPGPNGRPTTPRAKGCRLDRWVLCDERKKQYQVEIKNWSACALGGKRFTTAMDASDYEDRLRKHRMERWECTFNRNAQRFWNSSATDKVLRRMVNAPWMDIDVEPVICFWDPMHPKGEAESLFRVELEHNANGFDFGQFWVFSMSNYLRSLRDDHIFLDMPSAAQRLRWLRQLIVQECKL